MQRAHCDNELFIQFLASTTLTSLKLRGSIHWDDQELKKNEDKDKLVTIASTVFYAIKIYIYILR